LQKRGRPALARACIARRFVAVRTALVQVFGRRHDELFHVLWRPASKKRQGTKSREVWH
jgi:hypothetical protein